MLCCGILYRQKLNNKVDLYILINFQNMVCRESRGEVEMWGRCPCLTETPHTQISMAQSTFPQLQKP